MTKIYFTSQSEQNADSSLYGSTVDDEKIFSTQKTDPEYYPINGDTVGGDDPIPILTNEDASSFGNSVSNFVKNLFGEFASFVLGQKAFAASSVVDNDQDNIADDLEEWLARTYSPILQFDEDEHHAPTIETLWQVHPVGCVGQDCASSRELVSLSYLTLYEKDGGRTCLGYTAGAHEGDNELVRFDVYLNNNQNNVEAEIIGVTMSQHTGETYYSAHQLEFSNNRPVLHISQDKHASYPTKLECESSASLGPEYTSGTDFGGCWEEDCDEGFRYTDRVSPNDNVGESYHHLVEGLSGVFSGENAWGTSNFCGGYRSTDCASPNASKWDTRSFSRGGNPLTSGGSGVWQQPHTPPAPSPFGVDPAPATGSTTFRVINRTAIPVYVWYRSRNNASVMWDGGSVNPGSSSTRSYACDSGDYMCFGAWAATNPYAPIAAWGLGFPSPTASCSIQGCCYLCSNSTYDLPLAFY